MPGLRRRELRFSPLHRFEPVRPTSRAWKPRPPASEIAVGHLVEHVEFDLPPAYLNFLRRHNGGEGPLPIAPWRFLLWPAEDVVKLNHDFDVPDSYPGLIGLGSDGGAALLALDARGPQPWPVVAAPFVGIPEEILRIADAFEVFEELLGLGG